MGLSDVLAFNFAVTKRMFWPIHWSLCMVGVLHFDSGSHCFLTMI